jgi:hypothetical protein
MQFNSKKKSLDLKVFEPFGPIMHFIFVKLLSIQFAPTIATIVALGPVAPCFIQRHDVPIMQVRG